MPIMNYSQKKEALKRLLSSANLKNKGDIKPLASSLLQALKEKRPTQKQINHPKKFSQHLKQSQKDPIKVIQYQQDSKPEKITRLKKPPGIAKIFHEPKPTYKPRKEKEMFSPPSNLDSGFTPFFKSSIYFDEDGYFENLTTTETLIETIEETTITEAPQSKPQAFYQPQRNFGEKKSMQQKPFINTYSTTLKPNPTKSGRYDRPSTHLTTVPSYDGFLDNWDSLDKNFLKFNSQKQKMRKFNTKSRAKPYFDEWDRKQDYRRQDYKPRDEDYYKPLDVVEKRRDPEKQKFETTGFMDSRPFSLPLSFQSSFKVEPQKINANMLDRKRNQSQGAVRKTYPSDYSKDERSYLEGSNQRRFGIDKTRTDEPLPRMKTFEIEFRGNPENSFGDDFSFSDSNLGEFFDDISETFPDISDFGPSWESLKF